MIILDLVKPGSQLDYEDFDWCCEINSLLDLMITSFTDANISFNLFTTAFDELHKKPDQNESLRKIDEFWRRRKEFEDLIRSERQSNDYSDYINIAFEAERRTKLEHWNNGAVPYGFVRRTVFIHASSFINSIAMISRILGILISTPSTPSELNAFKEELDHKFPQLNEIRNSVVHIEDRARGFKKYDWKKREYVKLDLKPIDKPYLKSERGALYLNNFEGNTFQTILANGHLGEVDISVPTIIFFNCLVYNILNSFKWTGSYVHYPEK
ncbi:hypothetical protein UXO39_03835 [Enterobacter hormaechei]